MFAPLRGIRPRTPRYSMVPRSLMAVLALAAFAAAAAMHYQSPMLGAMAADFGVDAPAAGWIATLTFSGYLAGMVLIVPLGDRVDKRRLILSQLGALIVATLVLAVAPSLVIAAAVSFVIGMSACLTQSIVPVVVELAPPGQRGRVVGTLLSALFLGILFGRLAGGFIADHLGWRWTYVLSAVLLALLWPAVALRMPRMPATTALRYLSLMRSIGSLLRGDRELRRIAILQFLLGLCYGGFWATIAPMLALLHRLGPTEAGLMGIPGSAGTLVARPAGRWMDRAGAYPVVTAGVALVLAAFVIMEFAPVTVWAVIGGAILLDCGLRAAIVANQTQISSAAAGNRSRVNTVFGASIWSGNATGALLASVALAHAGWWAACTIAVASAALALAVQLSARSRAR